MSKSKTPRRTCWRCLNYCETGTLPNDLCTDCDKNLQLPKPGDSVKVLWGKYGVVTAKVSRISRDRKVFAQRYNRRRSDYTNPRRILPGPHHVWWLGD